jgi:hypothetical protein
MTDPSPFKEDLENAKEELSRLQNVMRDAGIAKLVTQYNGSGDSGYIEQVFINDVHEGEELNPDSGMWPKIENAAFAVLTYNYPGWEINEGSKGEIDFALNEDGKISVKIRHAWMEYVEQDEIDGLPPDMQEDNESSPSP